MTWKDPIVEEVRAIRRQIMAEFDNDLHKLCEHLQQKQKEHPERYVSSAEIAAQRRAVAEEDARYGTPRDSRSG